MYLKRVDGPRQVTLPDGTILSRADLPPPDTRRWVASRKAVVVNAVLYGLIYRSPRRWNAMRCRKKNSRCGAKRWNRMA